MSGEVCVRCHVRPGRPRTRLGTIGCGPCWAAIGGDVDAGEIGPEPLDGVPTFDPLDSVHWLRTLSRQAWVESVRVDGQRNLLAIAEVYARRADWETGTTWCPLLTMLEVTGVSETVYFRWVQELKLHGWLEWIEHGSTPDTRPMGLADQLGNRCGVYRLRVPYSPDEALAAAAARAAQEAEDALQAAAAADRIIREEAEFARATEQARAEDRAREDFRRRRVPLLDRVRQLLERALRMDPHDDVEYHQAALLTDAAHRLMDEHGLTAAEVAGHTVNDGPLSDAVPSTPPAGCSSHHTGLDHPAADQQRSSPVDTKGMPTGAFSVGKSRWVGGFSRASTRVDNLGITPADPWGGTDQTKALRARFDQERGGWIHDHPAVSGADGTVDRPGWLSWASRVPTTRGQRYAAAQDLQRRVPTVFGRMSARAVRAEVRPFWDAGWCNAELVQALDHRPAAVGQASAAPLWSGTTRLVSPLLFARSRLRAWLHPDTGRPLDGPFRRAVKARNARRALQQAPDLVQARHGRAALRLLKPGQVTVTPAQVTAYGRACASKAGANGVPGPMGAAEVVASPSTRAAIRTDLHQHVRDTYRDQLAAARADLERNTSPDASDGSERNLRKAPGGRRSRRPRRRM